MTSSQLGAPFKQALCEFRHMAVVVEDHLAEHRLGIAVQVRPQGGRGVLQLHIRRNATRRQHTLPGNGTASDSLSLNGRLYRLFDCAFKRGVVFRVVRIHVWRPNGCGWPVLPISIAVQPPTLRAGLLVEVGHDHRGALASVRMSLGCTTWKEPRTMPSTLR